MPDKINRRERKRRPNGNGAMEPPAWYCWLCLAAMLLLFVARLERGGEVWRPPMLSLGEWMLLPLGAASLSMGLLPLGTVRETSFLPPWLAAIVPGVLWMGAAVVVMLSNGVPDADLDLPLSWAVRLFFPAMAFLPLLLRPEWRDRLLWTLAFALALNAVLVAWQVRAAGAAASSQGLLAMGGVLEDQWDYGLSLAAALPLLASWRGGDARTRRALAMLFCMFLLPCLALGMCRTWMGLAAAGAGLVASWASWRGHAWMLGIFVCLLVFGYGGTSQAERDGRQRAQLVRSFSADQTHVRNALDSFTTHPYLGTGMTAGLVEKGSAPKSWYATLLKGIGLVGLGMWVVLLGELCGRALGRYGKRCLLSGGVLGCVVGVAVAGLWTNVLTPGAGSLMGLLLAISIIDEPSAAPAVAARRRNGVRAPAEAPAENGEAANGNGAKPRAPRKRADKPDAED